MKRKFIFLITAFTLILVGAYAEENAMLLQRAEAGDAEAQYELAQKYTYGEKGYLHDPELGETWYKKAVANFQIAADAGDAKAQCKLGECYSFGFGVIEDDALAEQWYRKAAEAGLADAQYRLGIVHFYGIGVKKDTSKGIEWLTKAAEQGYIHAQTTLGRFYKDGNEVTKNEELSKLWLSKAAEYYRAKAAEGDLEAQYRLGVNYCFGLGVETDIKKGFALVLDAAEKNCSEAQSCLAEFYEEGLGEDKSIIDLEKAKYWHRREAEGMATTSLIHQGNEYVQGIVRIKDIQEGIWFYEKAVERSSAEAENQLGETYLGYAGGGAETLDYTKAVFWLSKAAEKGHTDAQDRLAECYDRGWGVEQNTELAKEWKAKFLARHLERAGNGDIRSMRIVATQYMYGENVDKDPHAALAWYQKAADTGDLLAQLQLGEGYMNGIFGKPDHEKAILWLRKAATQEKPNTRDTPNAQAALGRELMKGNAQEIQEGIGWLKKAAATEWMSDAQYDLGKCYENGIGVEQDYAAAFEWYNMAAKDAEKFNYQNHENFFRLAYLYENGLGVMKDADKAEEWYWKAAENGSYEAREKLGFMYDLSVVKKDVQSFVGEWVW